MLSKKKRTDYLTYIEETPIHWDKLDKLAKVASREAVKESKSQNVAITYLENEKIIREYPNGRKEVIGEVAEPEMPTYILQNGGVSLSEE
ncbi:MAG: hypothetical protein K9G46_15675 [Flavobacteriales bacterium]|nr:hypothetical protein [Flavobacteriales bacterium]